MVRSAVTLDETIRRNFETELHKVLGQDLAISYDTEEEMSLGIELILGGLKLSWGVDSYFAELERQIDLKFEEVDAAVDGSGRCR